MKARSILTLTVIGLFLIGSGSAFAQKGMGHCPWSQEKVESGTPAMNQGLCQSLELTSDQIKQIDDARFEMKKELIPLQADLKLAKLELHEMIRSEASTDVIDKKIDELGAIESKIQKIKIRQKLQFRDALTDEQKKKLETMPGCGLGMGRGHGSCCGGRGGHGFGSAHGKQSSSGAKGFGGRCGNCPWMQDSDI